MTEALLMLKFSYEYLDRFKNRNNPEKAITFFSHRLRLRIQ